MTITRLVTAIALSVATVALTSADDNPPRPAIYKTSAELMAVLMKNVETRPNQADSPISNQSHYHVNIVRRDRPGPAGAHATGPAKGTEIHYIIDGAGTLVTGGTIVRPAGATNGAGSSIQGGESRHVAKGDVILIPEGTPHWYKEVNGTITYLEVRFDVPLDK